MANPAEPSSGQIYWPSPGSFTGHQRAHQLAVRGQKLMAIDIGAKISASSRLIVIGDNLDPAQNLGKLETVH